MARKKATAARTKSAAGAKRPTPKKKAAPKKAASKKAALRKPAAKKPAKATARGAKKAAAGKAAPAKARESARKPEAATRPVAATPAPRTTPGSPPAAPAKSAAPRPAAAASTVAIPAAKPAQPIKSFPAMPSKDGIAKSPIKLFTAAKSGRAGARATQRVGEARELVAAGSRPSFSRDFLDRQRKKLMAKKDEILAMYKKDLQSGQESNDSPTEDIVDRANNAYSRELAFSISDNERELMLQIEQAIERIDAGTYGFCLHTGHPIGQARLEAIPWAKYGVEAQEMLEKGLLSEA